MLAQLNLEGWIRWLATLHDNGAEVNDLLQRDPEKVAAMTAAMMEANGAGANAEKADIERGGPTPYDGAPSGPMGPGDMTELAGSMGGGLTR
jgi:hypothetical protein